MSKLSIVIVNWNTKELLAVCLSSVFREAAECPIEVIVVDNNSSDGSQQMIKEEFPQVRLIENIENVGFARANNQAFSACTGNHILLLNSDTCVMPSAFKTMVEFLDDHPDVGAVGPKIIHPSMRLRVLSCGFLPSTLTLFNQFFGLNTLFPENKLFRGLNLIMGKHDDRVRDVEWISGACLLVRKSVLEQVGGLSTKWFMFAEDMEWCERIGQHGWRLCSVPCAVVEHYFGASTEKNKSVSTMWVKSLREFYIQRKKSSKTSVLLFDVVLVIGLGTRSLYYGFRAITDREHREMWKQEAVRFIAYAKTAFTSMFN